MGVLDVLSGLAMAGGQAAAGEAIDQQTAVKNALEQARLKEEQDRNAVLNAVGRASIDPTLQGQLEAARANAVVDPHIRTAVGTARGVAPIHVAEAVDTAKQLAPIHTQEAVDTAKQMIPVKVDETTQLSGPQATAAGEKAKAVAENTPEPATGTVLPGTEGHPAQVVVTGGRSAEHPIGSTIAVPDVVPKSGTGSGMAQIQQTRANAALPQIDTALQSLDKYHKPELAARLFGRSPGGGYFISDEGQLFNQAADALATAYAGAKTRTGNPTPAVIQSYANQIKPQPGEGGNPAVIAAKLQRAHQWRDEIAAIGGQKAGGNVPDQTKMTDAEFAAAYKAGKFNR